MEYVQQHYPKKVTLEEAASRSGFNTTYFSEMFKHKTGKGFLDYVTEVRINAAKEMLRNTRKTLSHPWIIASLRIHSSVLYRKCGLIWFCNALMRD